MKQTLVPIAVFLAGLFVVLKTAGPFPFSITSTVTQKNDVFSVNGEGKVSVTPDIAYTSLGVEAQGPTVKQVQNSLNTSINGVIDALSKIGIKKEDMKTTQYSISPMYDYANGRQKLTGFQAHSSVRVTIKNLDLVNTVIDTATANGATNVGSITFDVEDKEKAFNSARDLAVKDAKKKADDAARIAGFSLGRIINYSESEGSQPRPIMLEGAKMAGSADAVATNIETGTSDIAMTVTISYELR